MTFHEEQFPGLDNGSRPAFVLLFPGNDPVGAVIDSVGSIMHKQLQLMQMKY